MVEYSDILAYVKTLFPEMENKELTKMSYHIWKYGNIKDISEISQKIKRNTNPKKKPKCQYDTEVKPSVLVSSQNPMKPLAKEEIIKQKAEAHVLKKRKNRKVLESNKTQASNNQKIPQKHKKHQCNHSYDDIIAETRGRCINGTFRCMRCGRTRHIGYEYKGYIKICLQCKQRVCKKSCGSIWAIYTPMK